MSPGSQDERVTFGFEEFWPVAYNERKPQFDAITGLVGLANDMLRTAEVKAFEPVEKVVQELTRATVMGMNDVILLCGNGSGIGALKIVRGMFESSWTAEYLRQHPNEIEDYIDFGRILAWRRYQWLLTENAASAKRVSPETVKDAEDAYNQVKARFTQRDGRVRNQWSTKHISKMAEEIGRRGEYDLPYSLTCSIHHANFEGLSAGMLNSPPSSHWLAQAMASAHATLWFALDTLNNSCNLGLSDKLKAAEKHLCEIWTK